MPVSQPYPMPKSGWEAFRYPSLATHNFEVRQHMAGEIEKKSIDVIIKYLGKKIINIEERDWVYLFLFIIWWYTG